MNEPVKVKLALPPAEAMQLTPDNHRDVLRWLRYRDIECGTPEDGRPHIWLRIANIWSIYDGYWIVCTPYADDDGVAWRAAYYDREAAFNELYRKEDR